MRAKTALLTVLFAGAILVLSATTAAGKNTAKAKDVRTLLKLTGAQGTAQQVITQIVANMRMQHPDLPDKFWKRMTKKINAKELMDKIVQIYTAKLEAPVVKAAIKFFSTPAGSKLIKAQASIAGESMEAAQAWGQKIAMQLLKEIQKSQKKGKKSKKSKKK